jgi:hypothetical protein
MTLPITAILCAHDEAGYLRTTLAHLVRNGIRLMVIDNGSTDATPAILDEFAPHIVAREVLPWHGELDLVAILERKAALAAQVREGWIIHQDSDEILESHDPHESLRAAIERIDRTPANTVNFEEFVFLPTGGDSLAGRDFHALAHHYYFHEPQTHRLMRAWRANAGLSQVEGGHRLSDQGRVLHPRNLVLRHYPFLDLQHAQRKYSQRRFAARGLAHGWHLARCDVVPSDMEFPNITQLKTWTAGQPLDTSDPWPRHYWLERKLARLGGQPARN